MLIYIFFFFCSRAVFNTQRICLPAYLCVLERDTTFPGCQSCICVLDPGYVSSRRCVISYECPSANLCEHLGSCVSFPIFWTSRGQCEQIGNKKRENTKGCSGKGWWPARETRFLFPPDQVPVTHYKCVTCLVSQKSRYAVSPEGCNASPTKAWLELEILCSSRLCPRSQSRAVQPAPRQLRSICLCTVRDEPPVHHKQRCNVLIVLIPENFIPSCWKL